MAGCNLVLKAYEAPCNQSGGIDIVYNGVHYGSISNTFPTLTIVDGEVTAISLNAGNYLYPMYVEMETAMFGQSSAGERANSSASVTQTGTMVLAGYDADMVESLNGYIRGKIFQIGKDNNGVYRLYFAKHGARVQIEESTGTAYEDLNGSTLTSVSKDRDFAPVISSVLVESLIAPPAPSIVSVSPVSGSVGASITLTGTDFTGSTNVLFGNVQATSFTVTNATTITAVVPTLPTGITQIKVVSPVGNSNVKSFEVTT